LIFILGVHCVKLCVFQQVVYNLRGYICFRPIARQHIASGALTTVQFVSVRLVASYISLQPALTLCHLARRARRGSALFRASSRRLAAVSLVSQSSICRWIPSIGTHLFDTIQSAD